MLLLIIFMEGENGMIIEYRIDIDGQSVNVDLPSHAETETQPGGIVESVFI
jgi:hypothetical protein